MENSTIDYDQQGQIDAQIEHNTRLLDDHLQHPEDVLIVWELLRRFVKTGKRPPGKVVDQFLLQGETAAERMRDWTHVLRDDLPDLVRWMEPDIAEYERLLIHGTYQQIAMQREKVVRQIAAIGPTPEFYLEQMDAYWAWRAQQGGQLPLFYAGTLQDHSATNEDTAEPLESPSTGQLSLSFATEPKSKQSHRKTPVRNLGLRHYPQYEKLLDSRAALRSALAKTEEGHRLAYEALHQASLRSGVMSVAGQLDLGTVDRQQKRTRADAIFKKLPSLVARMERGQMQRRFQTTEILNSPSGRDFPDRWQGVRVSRRKSPVQVGRHLPHLDLLLPAVNLVRRDVAEMEKGIQFLCKISEKQADLEMLLERGARPDIRAMHTTVKQWRISLSHVSRDHREVQVLMHQWVHMLHEAELGRVDLLPTLLQQVSERRLQLVDALDTVAQVHCEQPKRLIQISTDLQAGLKDYLSVRNRMVEDNRRLIFYVIDDVLNLDMREFDRGDLEIEGSIGLTKAADRYDPRHGIQFTTFATDVIKKHLLSTARSEWSTPHGLGGEQTVDFCDDNRDRVCRDHEDFCSAVLDLLPDQPGEGGAVSQRDVIRLRYGPGRSPEERTLKFIGAEFGLTKERIRQVEADAFRTLRESDALPDIAALAEMKMAG